MTQHDTTPTGSRGPGIQRRTVLLGVGAVGVAGVLAACGGDGDDPATAAPTTDATRSPDTPDTPAPSPRQTTPPAEGSGGTPLTATADVPVGGGVINTTEQIVVTQPTAGEFRAFGSTCTHQGCQVARVEDGLILCPCHGSRYSVEDGSVQTGPATEPLPEVAIVVEGNQVLQI
ncbi:MAG TPA: Rieske (2Fe-2S) protein [Jiangellaceae bacterium]|nr:Rieske (2Fe-2S) protein [Jiangellaceae bacterium]